MGNSIYYIQGTNSDGNVVYLCETPEDKFGWSETNGKGYHTKGVACLLVDIILETGVVAGISDISVVEK